jgi:MoxR-like ATPase
VAEPANPFLDVHELAAGPELLDAVGLCYEANLPLLLIGGTGWGKSTILRDFARSRKVWYASRDLSLMEPPDLVGLPRLEGGRTHFVPPAFLPGPGAEGLMVFEELNRAPRYVRSPCLELLTARQLGDYVVPDGVRFAATINPATDEFDVDELDWATLGRFTRVRVRPDRDSWLGWAARAGVDERVQEYVRADDSVFDNEVSNPRAWEMVSRLAAAQDRARVASRAFRAALAGCVGPKRAAAFAQFIEKGEAPLTADAVLKARDGAGAAITGWTSAGRLDLIEQTLLNILKRLQSQKGYADVRGSRRAWAALGKFVAALPADNRERAEEFFRANGYEWPQPKGTKGGKS